jgi:hypothetical protein
LPAVLILLVFSGCDGCRRGAQSPDDAKDEQEKTRVEDFESGELNVLPTDATLAAYGIKPGHWLSVRQQLKSNKVDFDGELESVATDQARIPYRLANSPFELRTRRPALLPKGQGKSFELTYFVPHAAHRYNRVWLSSELQTRFGGSVRHAQPQVTNRLRAHQAYLVVLGRNPDQYSYLKTLESIRPPTDELNVGGAPGDYIVVAPPPGFATPLPSWALTWTNISFVIWDDYDPAGLTVDQQRSFVDWLHWGGQLVISGPNTLENLRSSFLRDYLPAAAEQTQPATNQQLAELNDKWSVPSKTPGIDTRLSLVGETQFEVVQLKLQPGSQFLPGTGDLVAERRVGRGRVVVAGFALARRELTNWRSFDNFFNACLLRRPPRVYRNSIETGLSSQWSDSVVRKLVGLPVRSSDQVIAEDEIARSLVQDVELESGGSRLPNEALITSRLRFFSRDAALPIFSAGSERDAATQLGLEGYKCDAHAGIAGWNDFSECSQLARHALTSAAGISVPDRTLIIGALALYLFALVPANWVVFRALGRVEWAWAAVPLIALGGTVVVVRLARLDIGFARSRTEIAVVETQPEYARAHVTRFIGLYTSLSTDYELSFADDSAIAAPLATEQSRRSVFRNEFRTVRLARTGKRDANVQLQGLAVGSNTTEMVHTEQMLELGGSVRFHERESGLTEVSNETPYDLLHVAILRRRLGQVQFAALPLLKAGATLRIQFRTIPAEQFMEQWQDADLPSQGLPQGLDPKGFLRLAASPARLGEGDVRLVGWSDAMLPGLSIEPSASQRTFWNLWVVNLRFGHLPPPRSDSNSRTDFPVEESDDRTD